MNIGLRITKPRYARTAGLLKFHPTLWHGRHLANLLFFVSMPIPQALRNLLNFIFNFTKRIQ